MPRKLPLFILVLATVAVCIGGGNASIGAEQVKVPSGYTLKIIAGTEYLMSSAYIWNPRRRGSGVDRGFAIDAYLPNLAPLGPDNRHIAEMPGGNQYMYSMLLSETSLTVGQRFQNSRCSIDPAASPYGLAPASCDIAPNLNDTYSIVSNGALVAFVRCSKLPAPSPGCDLLFDYSGSDVIAHFPKRLLNDAPQVHRDIIGLLDGFVRAADETRRQTR